MSDIPPPPNPYGSQPPPSNDPYGGNPPAAGQTPYGSTPPPPPPTGQNPYGADPFPVSSEPPPVAGSQPGGLGARFVARLIDSILIGIVSIIIAAVTETWIGSVVGGILYLAYYVFMESSRGQTVGKMVMKLHTHGASGGLPTQSEAFRRNAWYVVGIIASLPLGIISVLLNLVSLAIVIYIAITINSDALKRGWHDKFGNTAVTKD